MVRRWYRLVALVIGMILMAIFSDPYIAIALTLIIVGAQDGNRSSL